MQKVILIPIDFQVESLNTLKLALSQNTGNRVKVVLMYCEHLSDSIRDLLFYSPHKRIAALASADFYEALSIIQNCFSTTMVSSQIELFHGYNVAAFRNFAAGNCIDEIYIPENYRLIARERSFDPLPIIKKSKLPLNEMGWPQHAGLSTQDQLAFLFV